MHPIEPEDHHSVLTQVAGFALKPEFFAKLRQLVEAEAKSEESEHRRSQLFHRLKYAPPETKLLRALRTLHEIPLLRFRKDQNLPEEFELLEMHGLLSLAVSPRSAGLPQVRTLSLTVQGRVFYEKLAEARRESEPARS